MLQIIAIITLIFTLPSIYSMYVQGAKNTKFSRTFYIHLPAEAMEDEDVKILIHAYVKDAKRILLLAIALSLILLSLLFIPTISEYILPFLCTVFFPVFLPNYFYARNLDKYRKRILKLKGEKGWNHSSKKIAMADLTLSRLKNAGMPKKAFFLIPAMMSISVFLSFGNFDDFGNNILFGISLLIHLLCFLTHRHILHSPAKIYVQERDSNLKINHEYRRRWSISFLITSLIQSIMLYLILQIQMGEKHIEEAPMLLFCILIFSIAPALVLLYSHFKVSKTMNALLENKNVYQFDEEDAYYEFDGIMSFRYNNPDNPSFWAKKWEVGNLSLGSSGMGKTLNFGNQKAKLLYHFSLIIALLGIAAFLRIIIYEDFISPVLNFSEKEIRIERTIYPFSVSLEEIENIELIREKFDRKKVYKDMGSATSRIMRGSFSQKGNGKIQLYLFSKSNAYIVFHLKNNEKSRLYFNYESEEDTLELFEMLRSIQLQKP